VVLDLRRRMYDRITRLPTSYFAQKGTADLMSRLTQDTSTLTQGVSMAFGKAIQEPVKALFSFVVALVIDWRLTMMIVILTPILAVGIRKFSKHLRKAGRRALENWSRMLGVINETRIGARVVKAYSGEGFERRRFTRINKALIHEQNRGAHYNALSRPTIETLSIIVTSIPMLIAARWVLNHRTEPEQFFTILVCFAAMLEPLRKLSDVNATVQQSNVAGARVFEIIDTPSEPNYNNQMARLPRHEKTVEFHAGTFTYPGPEEIVLRNISFAVKHGQNVAVVGGNGSGKSTRLSFLPRLYWPTQGEVRIDGHDIAKVSLKSLRKQIGLVTQDTLLFADTIYNNIAYGKRPATREQVIAAARRAYADEFITELPEGYDTKVGEHGVRLSGGQKQRIAIARAILHDPAILILDEAMSQIDADSESKIAAALRDFMKNRTTFMIAHRFQTVVSADVIAVLDKGNLVGFGKHHELLENCPAYKNLYETQFGDTACELTEMCNDEIRMTNDRY
jgi:ABC-type multidrug transport system fused ATPase/permease subunit